MGLQIICKTTQEEVRTMKVSKGEMRTEGREPIPAAPLYVIPPDSNSRGSIDSKEFRRK